MRIAALVVALLFVPVLSPAQPLHAAEPFARVEILTPEPIVAGQQVQVQVDVLVPNFFLSPPQFPIFDLPNAVVTLPDTRAMNLVETVNGESYAGIRRTYVVTPQAPGDFVLPPAPITFGYAAVPGQSAKGAVALPSKRFHVIGTGAASGKVAAATELTISQTLDRDPGRIKAGETLVRTITVVTEGMQAMMIPPPRFSAPDGVRIYPHDPVLSDGTVGRQGSIGGSRIDSVTYAFEKAGDYVLPAVEIGWYDPSRQSQEVARTPVIVVSVADDAAFKPAIAPPPAAGETTLPATSPWSTALPWAAAGALLAASAWLVARLWPRLRERWRARRLAKEQSEVAYFQRFEEACRTGDRRAIHAALDAWSRRAGIAPLSQWLSGAGDEATGAELERLERSIFSVPPLPGPYDADKLAAGLSLARRRWQADVGQGPTSALPALNP